MKNSNNDEHDSRPDEDTSSRREAERRFGPRVPVSIWVEEIKDDDLYFQQAGNLSVGGVFFERTIPHPIGTRVRLRFELPGKEGVIDTNGEVVSTPGDPSGLGAGIKFIDLDPVEARLIREFIGEHLEEKESS